MTGVGEMVRALERLDFRGAGSDSESDGGGGAFPRLFLTFGGSSSDSGGGGCFGAGLGAGVALGLLGAPGGRPLFLVTMMGSAIGEALSSDPSVIGTSWIILYYLGIFFNIPRRPRLRKLH